MQDRKYVIEIVAVGILISVLQHNAIAHSWYWIFWWMDIIMHFLGGLFVGLVAVLLLKHYVHKIKIPRNLFFWVLGVTLLIGIGWEIFEFSVGLVMAYDPLPDTILDIVMDMVGATVACVHAVPFYFKRKSES